MWLYMERIRVQVNFRCTSTIFTQVKIIYFFFFIYFQFYRSVAARLLGAHSFTNILYLYRSNLVILVSFQCRSKEVVVLWEFLGHTRISHTIKGRKVLSFGNEIIIYNNSTLGIAVSLAGCNNVTLRIILWFVMSCFNK